jgi:formate C-acetyltransferase
MFQGEAGVARMVALLRRFVAGRGHEMQFNVTDNGVPERAMENPEEFGDLIVRVGGFSDYFVNLAPEVQRDILRRSLHGVA